MHLELQKGNETIEGALTTRRPETPTTIGEIINELKNKNNGEIFISRNEKPFKHIKTLKLRRHQKIYKKEIKGALIIENEKGTYYDITTK